MAFFIYFFIIERKRNFLEGSKAILLIILILCFALCSGYFSLLETALTESHRSRLEKMADEGETDAEAALEFLENRSEPLSVAQIGITFVGILTGLITGVLVAPFFEQLLDFLPYSGPLSLILSVTVITCCLLLIGEFLPKKTALQNPERVLLRNYKSLRLLTALAHPFVSLLSRAANLLLLVFGINPKVEDTVTEDEVKDLIEQGTEDGTFEKAEQYMVNRIFHLSDQSVYALMTPRTQLFWLDLSDSLKRNLKLIRDHADTVFVAGKDNLDDFCGVLYAKELLDAALERKSLELNQYLHKPMFVPRSMEVFRLLEKFRNSGTHEAVVLDEYGGVVGFITLDDILNKIIGDTATGPAPEPPQILKRTENSWYVDGLYPIDEFKKRFDLDMLPEEDHDHFQTMGGFLTSYFGYLPKETERCEWNGFQFEIADMDRARIDKILVTRLEVKESEPEEAAETE